MSDLKSAVLNNIELSNDQIMEAFQMIGSAGNIVIIKNDGLRTEKNYTVVIGSPTERFQSIRFDSNSLGMAFLNCLDRYFEALPK